MSFLASLGHLKGLFYTGLVIDDAVFKLHYGFTTYLLLTMTFLLVGNIFISGQIYCTLSMYEFEKIVPKDMLNSYCFIHSTYVVPNNQMYLDDAMYKYEGIGPYSSGDKGDIVFHSYYQWVSLLLFAQGMRFTFWRHHRTGCQIQIFLFLCRNNVLYFSFVVDSNGK